MVTAMIRLRPGTAECECPHCHRAFIVRWGWRMVEATSTDVSARGECALVSSSLAVEADYERCAECPTCGEQLEIVHELVPEFYARSEHERTS